MAITKNKQSRETILKMAGAAFPERKVAEIRELTEGMCNVTYKVRFEDGFESILKISADNSRGNISNEIQLMKAEVEAMRIVRQHQICKVAEIYYYDTSKRICNGDYFFMEKIQGDNLAFTKQEISEPTLEEIHYEIGEISRRLTAIGNPKFGMLGDTNRYLSLYDFVKTLLMNLIKDAQKKNIDIIYDPEWFKTELEKDRACFEAVREATLIHWDLWEGNVFIKDGHVSGIIDWERAMWGEAFMDDRFRYHNRGAAFLKGFGKTTFSEEETRRLRWYDIILYLTMMIEVFYREYEDKGQYFWAKEMLEKVV